MENLWRPTALLFWTFNTVIKVMVEEIIHDADVFKTD